MAVEAGGEKVRIRLPLASRSKLSALRRERAGTPAFASDPGPTMIAQTSAVTANRRKEHSVIGLASREYEIRCTARFHKLHRIARQLSKKLFKTIAYLR